MKKIIWWQSIFILSTFLIIIWNLKIPSIPYALFLIPSFISFIFSEKKLLGSFTIIINTSIIFLLSIESAHNLVYQLPTNSGVLISIFETNPEETLEFIKSQNLFPILTSYLLAIIFSYIIYRRIRTLKQKHCIVICLSLIGVGVFSLITMQTESPLKYIYHFNTYRHERDDLRKRLSLQRRNKISVISTPKDMKQNVVLILGESTTRNRMSLYGYGRKTSPRLEKNQNLIVFNNIISPHCYTYKSIQKVFTLLSHEKTVPSNKNVSIIELAKAVDYKTFWISNQNPLGRYENYVTSLAHFSDHVFWTNRSSSPFDENILPTLNNILSDTETSKFIVIHLQGTHAQYKKRYPQSFQIFKNEFTSLASTPFEKELYNDYDNAILYNDYIVDEIFEVTKIKSTNYSVFYFSDHGEEVYQSLKISGHNESHSTVNMLEIPFLFATNNEQIKTRASNNRHKLWSIEDFIHSLHSILMIQTNIYEASNDIFSSGFIEKNRIGGNRSYLVKEETESSTRR